MSCLPDNPFELFLTFRMLGGIGNVMFCDFQVLTFRNYYEASSFLNSKAFAESEPACERE